MRAVRYWSRCQRRQTQRRDKAKAGHCRRPECRNTTYHRVREEVKALFRTAANMTGESR